MRGGIFEEIVAFGPLRGYRLCRGLPDIKDDEHI
jgi:hypothetical protein